MVQGVFPREDYRELLELAVTYLGGQVVRPRQQGGLAVGFRMRRPGAHNKTRFMYDGLYLLKIAMFLNQFILPGRLQAQVVALAEFVALLYVPYWLQSSLAVAAPRLDCAFWVDLKCYRDCHPQGAVQRNLADSARDSLKRHLWYLAEETVIFALFDPGLHNADKRSLARTLARTARPHQLAIGKPTMPHQLMTNNPRLPSFIGPRSWKLWDLLGKGREWLQMPVAQWQQSQDYQRAESFVLGLKVVNDAAERCIRSISDYAAATNDSYYREDILLIGNSYREVYQDIRKAALARLGDD